MLILSIWKKWFDMLLSGKKQKDAEILKVLSELSNIKWLGFLLNELDTVKDLLRKKETNILKEAIKKISIRKES